MKYNSKKYSVIVFSIYLLLLSWLILFKLAISLDMIPHMQNINLIPFAGSVVINGKIDIREMIYNIFVFIPIGVYIAIFKEKWKQGRKVLLALLLSLFYEIMQYIFSIGGSDITDVINNTTGGFLGVELYLMLQKLWREKTVMYVNRIGMVCEVCFVSIAMLMCLQVK